MLDFHFIYTAVLLILLTLALVKEVFSPDLIIFSVLLLLVVGGVITVQEAFAGFSNHGMLTVGVLFVVAGALQKTGILNRVGNFLLGGHEQSISSKLLRFLFPVSFLSAFFNNTPIVAMLIPAIRFWTKKNNFSVSKFLIPLSYAAILGGMCTLIGTSTNLVVHGLMLENGFRGFSLFEFSKIGFPVAIIGLFVISFVGHRLLPDRKEPIVQLGEKTREFVIAMKVQENYQYLNSTIMQAGLRHLKGLFLFQIERKNETIAPVTPDEEIQLGDRLFFTGLPETIIDLQKTKGLSLLEGATIDLKNYDSDYLKTFEVVVSHNSPLIGKNVRESQFRSQYNAVIIAIHRSGERIQRKIGDVVLRAGDTLLILARHDFVEKWYHSNHFFLVSESVIVESKPKLYAPFSLIVLLLMIIAMTFKIVPMLVAVSLAAVILVATKCITTQEATKSVDWSVLLIIASAFGISKALLNSGVAEYLADKLVFMAGSLGIIGIIGVIYFVTSLYTEIITNNAAAALMFPIALAVANQTGMDSRPLFIAVALAASASFATPIGYQTNLMVYGPGGYKFKDFLLIGLPMNIFIGLLVIAFIYVFYFV